MNENMISGNWKGVFTQVLQEEKLMFEVDFEMSLTGDEDGFNGDCKDLEVEEGIKEQSKVRGFIDDEMISLVKEYEHLILLNRKTETFILDKEKKHPEIHYYGTFNEATNRFEGTWEVESIVGSLNISKQLTCIENGTWWMQKVDQ
jgi:hypothetical protein